MSLREEDRKSNGVSRGLGLAAVAVGIGVGAAICYLFSKRQEHAEETHSEWQGGALVGCDYYTMSDLELDSDGYSTISETDTTDTSVHNEDLDMSVQSFSHGDTDEESYSEYSVDMSDQSTSSSTSDSEDENNVITDANNSSETGYLTFRTTMNTSGTSSNSDIPTEWDVTDTSDGIPSDQANTRSLLRILFGEIGTVISPTVRRNFKNMTEEEQINLLRQQAYRERPWTAEECSICFEMMCRGQELMTLPCTHNFHQGCILPWIQERQTCPNCRKPIE